MYLPNNIYPPTALQPNRYTHCAEITASVPRFMALFWTLHLGDVAFRLLRRHHIILAITGWNTACIILPEMIPLSLSSCANPICAYRKIILLYVSK